VTIKADHHQTKTPGQQRRVRGAECWRLQLRQVGQARVHGPGRERRDGKGGHPIDLCRYQILNNYRGACTDQLGRREQGASDLADAVLTAVINKRAGGMGLISGARPSSGR
jgi:hypothetical protein